MDAPTGTTKPVTTKPVTTTNEPAQKPGGNHADATSFDISHAFFGGGKKPETAPPDQSREEGAGNGSGEPEDTGEHSAVDGAEDAGNSGSGEEENDLADGGEAGEVWTFDGADYTEQQVSDALKQRGMYERFSQTITPLIENIRGYEETARRLGVMAQTETEKEIGELTRVLQSGKLDAREYQQAHQQLTRAQQRMGILETAAAQEKQQRAAALQEARTQNARLVGVTLIKQGWTMQKINEVQAVAQEFMSSDQFADTLSTGLMEVLKDAAELRRQRNKAADELRAKGKKAVKVEKTTPATTKAKKGTGAGSSEWIGKNFWGR